MATIESTTGLLRLELAAVEEVLRRHSESEIELLQEAARHILCAGGKRIRPQIVLLAAQALEGAAEPAIRVAAAAELVHTATLVHDDIVDESDSRRGRASVQFYFGNSASVLMGDYLVVRAFGIVADEGDPRLLRLLVDTIARMCEGEVYQIYKKGDTSIAIEVYETIVECKTAMLMSACGRFGGYLAGAVPEQIDALADYGYNLGMAFQIADDILDFTGDEATLGKPIGGDMREGKVTLPVIYALQESGEEGRRDLLALYDKAGPLGVQDVERACRRIEEAGGFERARRHANRYARLAAAALSSLPPSAARDALGQLAEQVVDRRA